ncbi:MULTISPECIES: hypothetical protein [Bacillus]|uniref:hypothetical protein n=1 Tax=Bacillus TaxID=1386 RepID=UPI0007065AC6|nr:hypothetical protein [Bacillus altitudinis]ALM29769.1 hypothetical protein AKO65_17670 [Bacillus altitudinis]ALM46305.1 hypothetical protein AMR71_13985 [Bacillus altitudinis]ANY97786.1 hypothetical protein AKO66_13990 [Bacillus altitudinis]MED4562707.1 hypothetical protein [Bacillus altitudinis]UOG08795.1 hypothetical protein MTX65_05920 [Bacillus altitudinis]
MSNANPKNSDGFIGGKNVVAFPTNPGLSTHSKTKALSIKEMQKEIMGIKELINLMLSLTSDEESDDVEKLTERISNLERDVAVLKERTKKLDDLPTKAEITSLFTDSINNSNIATKDHVNSKVEQATSNIIKWTIATTLTVGGLVIAIIKLF